MIFIVVLGLNFSLIAVAEAPTPNDFAYGANLLLEPNGALYTLTLADMVYDGVTRDDLGDVRVFNSADEVVPYILYRPPVSQLPLATPIPVTFSPLPNSTELMETQKGSSQPSLKLHTTATTTKIEIGKTDNSRTTKEIAYLVDTRSLTHRGDLRLHWEGTPDKGCIITVTMETSKDFTHWIPAGEGTLVDLPISGQRLRQDILKPRQWDLYLRLSWKKQYPAIVLKSIEVMPTAIYAEPLRQWRRVLGIPIKSEATRKIYEFASGGWLPIDRIRIHFPQSNTVVMAELTSRISLNMAWSLRFRGILYDLMVNGVVLRNEDITLPSITNTKLWRLMILGESSVGSGIPELEIGWVAHQVLFVARGAEPYRLVWGSSRWKSPQIPEAGLIQQLASDPQHLKIATMSAPFILAGVNALIPVSPPLPWLRMVLWLVIVSGVMVLAGMARHIYRQMISSPIATSINAK